MKEYIGNVELDYTYYDAKDIYSEGDEVEEKILQTVKSSTNYHDHLKVMAEENSYPVLYQLSRQRENIVEPMDIKKTDRVLEIGSGMGAVTGAIARKAESVDCIDLSKRRSQANAYRNRDYKNIKIFVGNFQKIKLNQKYDVITLIGVFEYSQHYIKSDEPYQQMLKDVYEYLKPGGKLYIAIENKLGMKYFAGCAEDHIGIPYAGIEGYREEHKVRTFTKSQLENLLRTNNFKDIFFYYPYPDYKMPVEIYSDKFLPGSDSFFKEEYNFDIDRIKVFDESKAFDSLKGTAEIICMFNSFLVEAIKELPV